LLITKKQTVVANGFGSVLIWYPGCEMCYFSPVTYKEHYINEEIRNVSRVQERPRTQLRVRSKQEGGEMKQSGTVTVKNLK
jgi:hypothetical protein